MNTPTSTTATTTPSNTPATRPPFAPLDFLQQFVCGFNGGVVFRTANGSPILSSIKEEDIFAPAQCYGVPRIDQLRRAPAQVRFLSIEPLLEDIGSINLEGIAWVICGGESGPGARPIRQSWVIGIRDQCQQAGVPFFFKQWGGVRKSLTGRSLEGRTYDGYPARTPGPVTTHAERQNFQAEIANKYGIGIAAGRLSSLVS